MKSHLHLKLTIALLGFAVLGGGLVGGSRADRAAAADQEKPAAEITVTRPASWPVFRGNPLMTGASAATLPDKLEVLWKATAEDCGFKSTAAIVGGVVYAATTELDGKVYALDLATGQQKWVFATESGFEGSPAVRDGIVFIGDMEGKFYALDAATGKAKWTFQTDAEIIASPNFYKDTVLVGSYDQNLYCLNLADGSEVWKLITEGPVHATPTVVDNRAFVAGCDQMLHVVNLDTGKQDGDLEMESQVAATPAAVGDRVYVGNLSETFFCVDWKKLEIVWRYQHETRKFPYHSSAAVTPASVIVGGRDKIVKALHPETGKLIWAFTSRGRIDSSPVVVGNRVFFGAQDGFVYGLNVETGEKVWSYEAGAPFDSSPAVAEGRLVIGNEDGELYCFGAK